jgi:hypothetical protein
VCLQSLEDIELRGDELAGFIFTNIKIHANTFFIGLVHLIAELRDCGLDGGNQLGVAIAVNGHGRSGMGMRSLA